MQQNMHYSQCGKYQILQFLGEGGQGIVKLAQINGEKVVLKFFKNHNDLFIEAKMLMPLSHPNIIKILDAEVNQIYRKKNGAEQKQSYLVLEYAKGGELYNYIFYAGNFKPEISRFYFKQLLDALKFMHNQNICHKDLKPANILLDSNFNLKIADFGWAKRMNCDALHDTAGTNDYMAPEIQNFQPYKGDKADIFSAGVTLFVMFSGFPPFQSAVSSDHSFKQILLNRHEQFWILQTQRKQNPEFFPPDFKHLINGMLEPNPEKRFTIDQCMQHQWLAGPIAPLEQIQAEFRQRYDFIMETLHQEMVQNKQKKILNQQTKNYQARGIGRFRINGKQDFLLQNYQDFGGRHLQRVDECYAYDILTAQEAERIFCELLKNSHLFDGKPTKISDTKFKINFGIFEADKEIFEIKVEMKAFKENIIVVKIFGKHEKQFQFYEVQERLRKVINNIKN